MISRRELNLVRLMLGLVILLAALSMLAGCNSVRGQLRDQLGGEPLGVSVSLGGFTFGVSGSIPLSQGEQKPPG